MKRFLWQWFQVTNIFQMDFVHWCYNVVHMFPFSLTFSLCFISFANEKFLNDVGHRERQLTSSIKLWKTCLKKTLFLMVNSCKNLFCFTNSKSYTISCYTGWSKKSVLFCFSSQSFVLQFFSIFFRWRRQQAWEILLTSI